MTTINYGEQFFADPHPTYAKLRARASAVHMHDPNGLKYWLVTRYEEARMALTDPALSKDPRHAWTALRDAGMVRGSAEQASLSMLTADPPDHHRLRAPVNKAFAPQEIERLRPRIQQVTDELCDLLAEQEHADLIDVVAFPLSVTLLCELLGIPLDDRDSFRAWTTAAHTPTYVTGAPITRAEGGRLLRNYVAELVTRRWTPAPAEAEPIMPPGLIDTLITDSTSDLTQTEVIETVSHLLLAGQDATTNLIGNAMAALLHHPKQLALLRRHPELIDSAVEELMRYDGPTARSSPRIATRDLNLGTATVRANEVVIVALSAANRDPARFPDPNTLDITRTDKAHLALGRGTHFCVAASLARMTGQIAIGTLVRRFPHLALARHHDMLHWRTTPVFRGLTSLPITTRAANHAE